MSAGVSDISQVDESEARIRRMDLLRFHLQVIIHVAAEAPGMLGAPGEWRESQQTSEHKSVVPPAG